MSNTFNFLKKRVSKTPSINDTTLVDTQNLRLYSQFVPSTSDKDLSPTPDKKYGLVFFGVYNPEFDSISEVTTGREHKALHDDIMISGWYTKIHDIHYESLGMYCVKDKDGTEKVHFDGNGCASTDRLCGLTFSVPDSKMKTVINSIKDGTPITLQDLASVEQEINDRLHTRLKTRVKNNPQLNEEYYL